MVPFVAPWPDLEGTPPCLNMLMYQLGVEGLAFIDVYVGKAYSTPRSVNM